MQLIDVQTPTPINFRHQLSVHLLSFIRQDSNWTSIPADHLFHNDARDRWGFLVGRRKCLRPFREGINTGDDVD